jgi:hypothetical protein
MWSTTYGSLQIEPSQGNTVVGDYGKGRKIRGRIAGCKLVGEWSYTGGRRGTLVFVLQADGNAFNGTWSEPGGQQNVAWSGTKSSSGSVTGAATLCRGSFAGSWSTTYGTLEIKPSQGNTVVGDYGQGRKIEGRINGCQLVGEWHYASGRRGNLRFVLQPDGKSFKGSWSESGGKQNVGWSGTKQ